MRIVLLDHELYRVGLRVFLAAVPEYEVVGGASTQGDAHELVREVVPDLVVIDTVLKGLRGVVGIRMVRREAPAARVLVLTETGERRRVEMALAAGATGYALKGDSEEETLRAIERVGSGRLYLAPTLDFRNEAELSRAHAMSAPAMAG